MSTEWRGDQVKRKMMRAAVMGVNRTMAEAVVHAKQNHPWQNRTGTLEGSTQISQYAKQERDAVVGRWGSVDVNYALRLELGGYPYLRPAADETYGKLQDYIRREFSRL